MFKKIIPAILLYGVMFSGLAASASVQVGPPYGWRELPDGLQHTASGLLCPRFVGSARISGTTSGGAPQCGYSFARCSDTCVDTAARASVEVVRNHKEARELFVRSIPSGFVVQRHGAGAPDHITFASQSEVRGIWLYSFREGFLAVSVSIPKRLLYSRP